MLWGSFHSVQGNIHMHKCLAVDEEILCSQICWWNLQPSTEPCIRQAVQSDRRAWITASETFSGSVVFVVGAMDLPHAPSPERYSAESFIQQPERFFYDFFFLYILDWKLFLLCVQLLLFTWAHLTCYSLSYTLAKTCKVRDNRAALRDDGESRCLGLCVCYFVCVRWISLCIRLFVSVCKVAEDKAFHWGRMHSILSHYCLSVRCDRGRNRWSTRQSEKAWVHRETCPPS